MSRRAVHDDRRRCEACGLITMQLRAAEALADAVERMVRLHQIDSRSLAGDALLDYRDPARGGEK